MSYNPNIHHRRSIRLKGYDYSKEGLYFITICCENRICFFGKITKGQMECSPIGQIAMEYWENIPKHFPRVVLHECIVMPNHVHGIIEILDIVQTPDITGTSDIVGTCHGMSLPDINGNTVGTSHGMSPHQCHEISPQQCDRISPKPTHPPTSTNLENLLQVRYRLL